MLTAIVSVMLSNAFKHDTVLRENDYIGIVFVAVLGDVIIFVCALATYLSTQGGLING